MDLLLSIEIVMPGYVLAELVMAMYSTKAAAELPVRGLSFALPKRTRIRTQDSNFHALENQTARRTESH
jgi:hypothetical protein